jgi:tetratricopeptide (TPR) repeat protein
VERVASFKYRAFISYSHRDTPWARWLHSALERYRIDGDLVGRESSSGTLPKTLRPIFRDREEFSAGHSLTEQTLAALDASQFLIVLCSPSAAISKYVNEEVRYFKANGDASRVIPIIVNGEPGDARHECFPPALRFKLRPDGTLSDEPEEPLAADARQQGDGKEIAKQKVIAGLLGLGLDEVMRRAERARKRRTRFVAGLAAVFLLLAVAAAGSAVYAYQKLIESNNRLDEAIEIAYGIVTKATEVSDRYGVSRELTLNLLEGAEGALNELIAKGADTTMLRHRRAMMLVSFSDNYRWLGRFDDATRRAMEAHGILKGLTERSPTNVEWQNDLAISEWKVGDNHFYSGHYVEAQDYYRSSLQGLLRYPDPKLSDRYSYYLLWSYDRLAEVQIFVGDVTGALANASMGYSFSERVISERPNDVMAKRNVGLSNLVICDVARAHGDYAESLARCRTAVSTLEQVVANDDGNSRWQRDLAWSELHLGATLVKLGFVEEAIRAFRSAISIDERLVVSDGKNILWNWHLWAGKFQLGQALLRVGQLDESLAKCREAFALASTLGDTHNFQLRRRLAWSHMCIGDVQTKQSNPTHALENYRQSAELLESLAGLDTQSAVRKSDLSWSYNKAGDALLALGRHDEALETFRKALIFAKKAIDTDPNNVDLEWVLLWSEWRLSEQGDDSAARLGDMAARMEKLKAENRLSADLARLLPIVQRRLAKLSSG